MIDVKQIKNPTKEYRAKPFWSLNGKLKKEELKKQILNMKKMGFGGAFLHSRSGLKTEYMGEEWLDLMDYCVQVLKENDMEAYLYDEDRWPSGTCGGYVTMDRTMRCKSMVSKELVDDKLPENLLGVFAVKLNAEGKCVSYRKIENYQQVEQGEKPYAFYWREAQGDDPFFNGQTYIDTMYKPAVEKFLELTHEKYKAVMGDKFGKEIVGVFMDEPNRGPMLNGFSRIEPERFDEVPYTVALFEEFEKRMGYKLQNHLPVIWFGKESDPFVKETYDFLEVVQQLFVENYAMPYYEWCEKNKLCLTGHILHEDNLACQVTMCGSIMRFFEYMSYPGMDNLGSESTFYTVPELVSSAAKQLGRKNTLDELYGCTGWHMNLSDYKRIGDWQTAGGITLRCPHLSWYTMEGDAKRDCPASLFHQSAWYTEYHYIEDYFARLTYLLKEGDDMVDTAIINPIESAYGLSNKYTFVHFFGVTDPIFARLEYEYATLCKDLRLNGQAFDYIDEGLFAKYGSVNKDEFICGLRKYKKIIVNANYNMRSTTLSAIKDFIANGGKVYCIGEIPSYLDGVKHDFNDDLKGAVMMPFDTKTLLPLIMDTSIINTNGNVIVEKRRFGEDLFVFALSQEKEPIKTSIKIATAKKPLAVNLRTGEITDVEYRQDGEYVVVDKELDAYEEFAIICSDSMAYKKAEKKQLEKVASITSAEFNLLEDNMLVLDYPRLYVNDELLCQKYFVFCDHDLRKKYGLAIRHCEQMVQPWFKEKYFDTYKNKYGRVTLEYDFNIKDMPEDDVKYMFEEQPAFELVLNGEKVKLGNKQSSEIDNCFTVVTLPKELLKVGKNTISTSFDFYEYTNIEGSFILGNFGVELGNDMVDNIVKLPNKLKVGDLREQGLPYYGGRIRIEKELEPGEYLAKTNDMDLSVELFNGNPIIFKPFETDFTVKDNKLIIEMALNRNNSFATNSIEDKRNNLIKQGFEEIIIYKKI